MSAIRRILITLLAAALLTVVVPFGSTAEAAFTEWYVSPSGSDTNAGTEASPFRTITKANSQASGSDMIRVQPGVYSQASGESFPIYLKPGVRLRGDGGPQVTTIQGDGAHRVIQLSNPDTGSEISGFTITGGVGDGAGLKVTRSSGVSLPACPTIANCVFEDNGSGSSGDGGAMYFEGASGVVCQPFIVDAEIVSNEAHNGGGIYLGNHTDATIDRCTITHNTATADGGGVFTITVEGGLSIHDSEISHNAAAQHGGGLYSSTSAGMEAITLARVRVDHNSAGTEGGGWWCYGSGQTVERSTFVGNSAGVRGGGMYVWLANIAAESGLIAKNSAPTGGAAWAGEWGSLYVSGCTVADNAGATWAGLWAESALGAWMPVNNSVVWGHGGKDVRGASSINYTCTQDVDLTDDGNEGIGNVIHADPAFVSAPSGDYRLTITSPCVDAAHPVAGCFPDVDYFGTLRPTDGDGDGTPRCDMGFHEFIRPTIARLAGADRYATAALIAQSKLPDSGLHAVIACGQDYPDALSAAGLAGSLWYAPLLLVRKDSVPQVVLDALEKLGTRFVWIVGGTPSVSARVEGALRARGLTVTRIAGPNRYATAAAVAAEVFKIKGTALRNNTAFIARGDAFPDALSLSPVAFAYSTYQRDGGPILLTRPGSLPSETASALTSLGISRAFVAGSDAAVSSAVKAQIDARLIANGGSASVRWAGANRYETARAVAEGAVAQGWVRWQHVGIATGTNFPDALGGGIRAGAWSGVVLLTRSDILPGPTDAALKAHRPDIRAVEIFGGPTAVSNAVQNAIRADLGL